MGWPGGSRLTRYRAKDVACTIERSFQYAHADDTDASMMSKMPAVYHFFDTSVRLITTCLRPYILDYRAHRPQAILMPFEEMLPHIIDDERIRA